MKAKLSVPEVRVINRLAILLLVIACGCDSQSEPTSPPDGGANIADASALADATLEADATVSLPPDACVPEAWFPDCDGDGASVSGALATESCTKPAQPDSDCPNQSLADWVRLVPNSLLTSDCNDDNDQIGVATSHYVDCDGDGFARSTAGSVTACEAPAASDLCVDSEGAWTSLQPVGDAYDENNTSVDCVDTDEDAYPGQGAWFTLAIVDAEIDREFDYNCDGLSRRRYGSSYTCSLSPYQSGYICTHTPGYFNSTACGEQGSYRSGCTIPGGASCAYASSELRTQQCR